MRFSLLRKLFGRKNQPSPRPKPVRFRPQLEYLEARTLLSATIYVNAADASAPVQDGSFANPYGTIQQGVSAANPAGGDTVQVAAGTYTGQIIINKSLTLDGAQAGVDARGGRPAAPESVLSLSTYGLEPEADNITINGFKIVKAPTGSPNGLLETYSNANSFTLENTILNVSATASSGVVLFGGGSHTNMVFSQNLFQDQGNASLYFGGTSGYDNLSISSNKFLGNSGGVFWASASPLNNGVIQGNEFDGTVGGVPGVGDPLLNIGQSTNLTIADNNFHDMDYTAFQVGMNGGSIVRNTFSHIYADPGVGFGDAFQLWGGQYGTQVSTNVTIADNTIHYNDIAGATNPTRGIRLRLPDSGSGIDGSTIHIHGNLFLNGGVLASVPAVVNQGDQTKAVDATANWFGSPAGPGAGAAVGNVNFTPWLLDPNGVTVAPSSGPTTGTTNVTIAGFGVTAATAVHFGSTPATSFSVNTDGTITAVAPPGAAGPEDVTVTRPAGTTVATTTDVFTYFAKPSITNLAPTSGLTSGGTLVTITGSGFTGATAVNFGANAGANLHVLTDSKLTVTAPAGSAGPANVTVVGPGGTSTAAQFTYVTAGTPIVASVSPNSGSIFGGDAVTISGSGFTGATGVQFGTVTLLPNINFFVFSDNQIYAVVPAGSAGPVDVRVTTAAGTSAIDSADKYTYFALGAPSVTSVVSSSGSATGGNTVTITGTGFTGATAVHFGTTSATSFTVVNLSTMHRRRPGGDRHRGRDGHQRGRHLANQHGRPVHLPRRDGRDEPQPVHGFDLRRRERDDHRQWLPRSHRRQLRDHPRHQLPGGQRQHHHRRHPAGPSRPRACDGHHGGRNLGDKLGRPIHLRLSDAGHHEPVAQQRPDQRRHVADDHRQRLPRRHCR